MEENNRKINKSLLVIYIIVIITICGYSIFWFIACNKYREIIEVKIKEIPSLTYKSARVSGFPFKFGLKFKDLKFSKTQYNNASSVEFESIIFSKTLNSEYNYAKFNRATVSNNNEEVQVIIDGNNEVKFKLIEDKLQSIDVMATQILIRNPKDKNKESVIKNVLYKTELIKNNSYENKPHFLDIESISLYSKENGKSELVREMNLSLNLSMINVLENSEVISNGFELEKLVVNGVTDNYSISMKGDTKTSKKENSVMLNIDIKNYDNLISIVKDPVHIATINTIYKTIPDLDQQGKDKHITIKKEANSSILTINDKNIQDILSSVLGTINTLK